MRHERSLGPAAARNTGWRVSSRPLVLFIDADVEGEPGWLDPLLALLGRPVARGGGPPCVDVGRRGPPLAGRF